jgi:hypothetical protein
VRSACVLCSNGCLCDIAVKDERMVGIRGRGGALDPGEPLAGEAEGAFFGSIPGMNRLGWWMGW